MIEELMSLREECLNGDFSSVAILREKNAGVRHRHSCSELSSESVTSAITTNSTATSKPKLDTEAIPSKLLLAGYLAHEYLTKGTIMGKPWVTSRVETTQEVVEEEGEEATEECRKQDHKEVTWLLQNGETHLEGVVNPSQLAPFS